jgi:ATP-binding cassette subfamily B protein
MRQEAAPLLRAQGVGYDHAGRGEAVLREVDLSIRRGERVLLEGDSGGGKSTLCAVLAGLREARSGLLLLRGLDPGTLGAAAWRTQVVLAPQDHENHILSGSLAFNLLLGRAWPPSRQDLDAAVQLCEQLGLGPVLARMPAGLLQMVGETGWQLSHGERSRVYLARALLQRPEISLLDESLAALDPETMIQVARCLFAQPSALLVVAQP